MLDVKLLRTDFAKVEEALRNRQASLDLVAPFPELDQKRRELIQNTEQLKNRRNTVSQEVAAIKKAGGDADALITEMREVGDRIKELDEELRVLDVQVNELLQAIPNIPHESVPVGGSEDENVELRRVGEPTAFAFEPKAHYDLAAELRILDFERAAKVTGSRFVFYRGLGARLERALMSFMMDLHSDQHGYEEILPPYIVNRDSLIGTGQLPKFEEDLFKIAETDYYLIPTAEVPVTNILRDEILDASTLPAKFVAFSACFRSEAGAAGRDTRGLIRQHQFNKVELVKLVKPEDSYAELESLTADAEKVLQLLELPYRVITLCTGDMGFASAKTYDIEVWLPSANTYREISSCTNFEDFQARRAGLKYRPEPKSKPEFVHTLNGSGLALGRTVAAILENYQQADGSIVVPKVLRPYMGGIEVISAK